MAILKGLLGLGLLWLLAVALLSLGCASIQTSGVIPLTVAADMVQHP